jgi:hypothetical protein
MRPSTPASHNDRGSDTSLRSWLRVGLDRRSSGYCQVTFDHPPINMITATAVAKLVGLMEPDPDLKILVFNSANPDSLPGPLPHRAQPGEDRGPRESCV